ncbi:LysR family transcriptional regulator [Comamonas endophytica]|uniref:LysR family transcriptional regulator n=1 Tax=Comamonas endophytica TaxID=2949090 RepID=A0ABY6G8P7_9BURK|nr:MULTISPECIES: LysR family transcriptional regulator [unclassified Acidovorax]MCD2514260.1 LysR family transcriptional regulator [Acidovorax sp. D4N7]UYG51399.1 LysR family transcriptional regulator [Acidovorax sp. 5MLIR]
MDLHLRDLRYFETAAELGHFGQAADQLARSQPALTKCIQRLEEAFGSPLFVREGRGVRLTPVGEMLLGRARLLRNNAEELVRQVNEFAQGQAGHVRVGSGPVAADHLLPQLCALAMEGGHKTTIGIVVGPSWELREQLREGRIDLLIGLTIDGDPNTVSYPIVEDVVVVAASRTHPVFREPRITMQTLLGYAWALPAPNIPSRAWLDMAFSTKGLATPGVQIEASSIALLPRMIARTHLLSFVSRHTLELQGGGDLREVRLKATTLRRKLGVTVRASGELSPAARRIVELLRSRGREIAAHHAAD